MDNDTRRAREAQFNWRGGPASKVGLVVPGLFPSVNIAGGEPIPLVLKRR
jgi:hypothetical protein